VGLGPNDAYAGLPVRAVTIQPDQRVLVGGYFRDYDGSGQKYLARVLNDWPVLDSRKVETNEMELRWPAVYTNFVLQAAPAMPSKTWTNVSAASTVVSNMWVVRQPSGPERQFYRLVKK
jgi:hypothetical protein